MFLIDKDAPPLLEETKKLFMGRPDISKLQPAQKDEKWAEQKDAIVDFFSHFHGQCAAESLADVEHILAMERTDDSN